jgi:hypothetical protein
LLDKEIANQELAIKYNKRALKKLDYGIHRLMLEANRAGAREKTSTKIANLGGTIHNWVTNDRGYIGLYRYKSRAAAIDRVRMLHNFVRRHLGLDVLEDNRNFPICVFTNVVFTKDSPSFAKMKKNEKRLQPELDRFGILAIPLE